MSKEINRQEDTVKRTDTIHHNDSRMDQPDSSDDMDLKPIKDQSLKEEAAAEQQRKEALTERD